MSLGPNGNGVSQLKNTDGLGGERCALLVGTDRMGWDGAGAAPRAALLGHLQPTASAEQRLGHPAAERDQGQRAGARLRSPRLTVPVKPTELLSLERFYLQAPRACPKHR